MIGYLRLIIFLFGFILGLISCGNNSGGSAPVTEDWLEAVPAELSSSPFDDPELQFSP